MGFRASGSGFRVKVKGSGFGLKILEPIPWFKKSQAKWCRAKTVWVQGLRIVSASR